jgi:hypothetical protein
MRVKVLAAGAGLAALTAVIAVPGISNASRLNTHTAPQVQTETTTTEPAVETPTTQPVETTTTTTQPVVVEPTTQPKPVVTTTTTSPAPTHVVVKPVPVVETPPPAPTVDVTRDQPAPVPTPAEVTTDQTPADPCHMDDYHAVQVDSLTDPGEAARAHKVDRNGNGVVCRKDIPGRGRGNTGNGSNIKDDQAG